MKATCSDTPQPEAARSNNQRRLEQSSLTQQDTVRPTIFESEPTQLVSIQPSITESDTARPRVFISESTHPDLVFSSILEAEPIHTGVTLPGILDSRPTRPDIVQHSISEAEHIHSGVRLPSIPVSRPTQPDIVQHSILEAESIQSGLRLPSIPESEPTQPTIIQPSILGSEFTHPGFFGSDLIVLDPENMAAADRLSVLMLEKPHSRFAIQEARKAEREIRQILYKTNTPFPPYNFIELIGKGTYGRVYKVRDVKTRRFMALKIVDCDAVDFRAPKKHREITIAEMMKEIDILVDLKEHGVKNINAIFDAFEIHSQVWILSEYCPGGSIKTLMRAKSPLEEKYIKVIARELAVGLESIHSIGVLHRDIKGANVMIHERGELQIIDFGVSATLSSSNDKRSTFVGTPHWMSPELINTGGNKKYGQEVDIWAYGITLFEMATGSPPSIGAKLDYIDLMKNPPRLNDDRYSPELHKFIADVLQPKTEDRLTMEEIRKLPYISANQEEFPTEMLSEMVVRFQKWEQAGNQRSSLINPALGAAMMLADDFAVDNEDWNFSTTAKELDDLELDITVEDIDTALSRDAASSTNHFRAQSNTQNLQHASDSFTSPINFQVGDQNELRANSDLLLPSLSQYPASIPRLINESNTTVVTNAGDQRPPPVTTSDRISTDNQCEVVGYAIDDTTITPSQGSAIVVSEQFKSTDGKSVQRGAGILHDIYDPKATDLPLRTSDDTSTNHQELHVEAGPSAAVPAVVLSNVATVRANAQKNKRKTMEWSFADAAAQAPAVPSRPQLLHSVTAPAGPVHDAFGTLDLDAMMQGGTGTLDLDALMAGDSEAESSTMRPYGQKEEEHVEEEKEEEKEMAPVNRFAYVACLLSHIIRCDTDTL